MTEKTSLQRTHELVADYWQAIVYQRPGDRSWVEWVWVNVVLGFVAFGSVIFWSVTILIADSAGAGKLTAHAITILSEGSVSTVFTLWGIALFKFVALMITTSDWEVQA